MSDPRETKIFFQFRDARKKGAYCYLRFPPSSCFSVNWGDVGEFFGGKIAALSGMALMGFRVRHSWTVSGKNNTDAAVDASRVDVARLVFRMTDSEFRGVSVTCYPPVGGGWKYTTELDALAADMIARSAGIYRKSNGSRAWFQAYSGAYHGLEFYENKGDKKWEE